MQTIAFKAFSNILQPCPWFPPCFSRDAASQRVPVTLFTLARVKNFGCEPNDTRLTDGKSACALFMQAFAEEQEGSSRLFAYLRQEHHGIGGNLESSKRQHGHRTQHLVLLSKEKHWVVGHRSCNQKALGCWQLQRTRNSSATPTSHDI